MDLNQVFGISSIIWPVVPEVPQPPSNNSFVKRQIIGPAGKYQGPSGLQSI